MQVEWHKFEDGMPEEDRELWVCFPGDRKPYIVDSIDASGWGWISEMDCDLVLTRDWPTHWAYHERPVTPTE